MEKSLKALQCVIDPAFDAVAAKHCLLAVELSRAHVCLAVYDRVRNLWVALEEWPADHTALSGSLLEYLMIIREGSALMKMAYADTVILWNSRVYSLVPQALYVEKSAPDYLTFAHNVPAGDCVLTDAMKNLEAVNVYSMPMVLHEGLLQLLPDAHFQHAITNLAESQLVRFSATLPDTKILLNADHRFFDMLVYRGRGLIFCNSFDFSGAEDVAYYALFVMEQLRLDPRENQVLLSGLLKKPSEVEALLSRYMANVRFISANPQWKYSYVFDDLAPHYHYNLLNLLACES